ncbi:MAG: glycosyltransferase family 2 protein, partial [Flavobacterium sp.]
MIFNFLRYIKPTWYFNLKPAQDFSYFPNEEILEKAGISLKKDTRYKSLEAQERDLAWRAFQCGFISSEKQEGIDVWKKSPLPVADEYRFIRKNFHSVWASYILLFRLATFKNPITEVLGYLKSRSVARERLTQNIIRYSQYETFQSELVQSNPLVSVIIPTLNRYDYLKEVFKDLENQTYKNFEVIVVDQTDAFCPDFYKGWNLNLHFWFQEEKALWKARNEAIKSSKGAYILMSEDDIRIPEDFIENHLKVVDFFKCDASCGVFFPEGSSIPVERSYFKYAEQFATGNSLLKRELFTKVGLYDRQFEKQRMGDGEFGLRLFTNGFKLVSNPLAYCVDVKAPEGGLRIKGGSWDAWRPKSLFDPRPVPSVLYLSRKYFGNKNSLLMLFANVFPSYVPYKFKKNKYLKLFSVLLIPFLLPLILFQVTKSWNLASKKLKAGSLIGT